MGPGEPELIHICLSFNKHYRNLNQLGRIQSGQDRHPTFDLHPTQQRAELYISCVGAGTGVGDVTVFSVFRGGFFKSVFGPPSLAPVHTIYSFNIKTLPEDKR